MSRDPLMLVPELYPKWQEWDSRMMAKGIDHVLTCTARWLEEQMALYLQGRDPLDRVNIFRSAAGMGPLPPGENKIVTWTLLGGKHVIRPSQGITKARAFDFAIVKNGKATWDLKVNVNWNEIPDYQEAGQIGKECGLIWGGDFKNGSGQPRPDYPHLEI